MKTLSRVALAALLTGAVCLPAFADAGPAAATAPKKPVTHVAAGAVSAKPDAGQPATAKPAAVPDQAGGHAPATPPATPPAGGATPSRTN
jgi:hypothetical protein